MCGRFVVAKSSGDLVSPLGVEYLEADLQPSWNVAPTTLINTVYDRAPAESKERPSGRYLGAARWGMLAPWSKHLKDGARTFNARSETAATKPTFRSSVKSKRAVIPANGYYEWYKVADHKTPYFVHDPNEEWIYFAGLCSWWRDPAAGESDDAWVLLTWTSLSVF